MQIAAHPLEAALGGDPSTANKVRAYVDLKFCKNGAWTDKRLEVSPRHSDKVVCRNFALIRSPPLTKNCDFTKLTDHQ